MRHADNGILFSAKKKWATKPWKFRHRGTLSTYLLSERSQSEKAMYYMISTIWHSGQGKTMEAVKISVVVGWGRGEGRKEGAQRIFRAVKLFCMLI